MGFLSNNSILGKFFGKIGDLILLNILFIVCSIPIITIGASLTSLFFAAMRIQRYHGETSIVKDFFRSFKENFKQSTVVWIASLLIGVIFWIDIDFFTQQNSAFIAVMFEAAAVLIGIVLMYLFPVIAAFQNKTKFLIKHSLYFAFSNPLYLLCVVFFYVFPMYLTYTDLGLLPLYSFIWAFIGFGLSAYIISFFMLKKFEKFLPSVETELPNEENNSSGTALPADSLSHSVDKTDETLVSDSSNDSQQENCITAGSGGVLT